MNAALELTHLPDFGSCSRFSRCLCSNAWFRNYLLNKYKSGYPAYHNIFYKSDYINHRITEGILMNNHIIYYNKNMKITLVKQGSRTYSTLKILKNLIS